MLSIRKKLAWATFFVSHDLVTRRIELEMQQVGSLTLEMYSLLLLLELAPGRKMTMTTIADELVYSKSGLTRLINRAADFGYLYREASPDDGRSAYAVLTATGLKAREDAWVHYEKAIEKYFGEALSEEESEVLDRILLKFTDGRTQFLRDEFGVD